MMIVAMMYSVQVALIEAVLPLIASLLLRGWSYHRQSGSTGHLVYPDPWSIEARRHRSAPCYAFHDLREALLELRTAAFCCAARAIGNNVVAPTRRKTTRTRPRFRSFDCSCVAPSVVSSRQALSPARHRAQFEASTAGVSLVLKVYKKFVSLGAHASRCSRGGAAGVELPREMSGCAFYSVF